MPKRASAASSWVRIELPARPLSPWLRLAHVTRMPGDATGRGFLRTITDHMLMMQIEGTSYIWWDALGGSVELPSGSIAFVPPGHAHAYGVTPGAHIAVHFDLHAQPTLEPMDMLRPLTRAVVRTPLRVMPRFRMAPAGSDEALEIALVTSVRRPSWWRERLEPLVRMYAARRHRSLDARVRASEILSWAVGALADAGESVGDPRIARLLGQIDERPQDSWLSIGVLAKRAGMGEAAFRRAFAREAGTPPRTYFERFRVDRAARLLIDTDRRIADVATEAGYTDPYHFSRAFRRVTGVSPRSYRSRSAADRR